MKKAIIITDFPSEDGTLVSVLSRKGYTCVLHSIDEQQGEPEYTGYKLAVLHTGSPLSAMNYLELLGRNKKLKP